MMMDMTKDAMMYIEELVDRGAQIAPPMEICGKTYAKEKLYRMDKKPKAEPLRVNTLTGLIDYVLNCKKDYSGSAMLIHVVSPTRVEFTSALDEDREREVLCIADALVNEFRFNSYHNQEDFILAMQANFMPTPDRELILKFAGNAMKQNEVAYADDGVTQTATMKMGASTTANVQVPNPVTLQPFRTFQEVKQPETQYVFRMRGRDGDLQFLLTDAANGIWVNEAIYHIKTWISEELMKAGIKPEQITVIG